MSGVECHKNIPQNVGPLYSALLNFKYSYSLIISRLKFDFCAEKYST